MSGIYWVSACVRSKVDTTDTGNVHVYMLQ